jgi:hypothetical protein
MELTFPVTTKPVILPRADYGFVPVEFANTVCRCLGERRFVNPFNTVPGTYDMRSYPLLFPWWVCAVCMRPAPLNALNARLIRECEACEEPYLVSVWPDNMNLCAFCLENN